MTDTTDNKSAIKRHIDHIEAKILIEYQHTLVDIIQSLNGEDSKVMIIDYIQEKLSALQPRISALHVTESHLNN